MAWKQIKIKALGNSTKRAGSFSRRMLFIWCMLASVIFYLVPQNSSYKLQLAFAHVFRLPLSAGRKISIVTGTQQELSDTVPRKEYEALEILYENLRQTNNQQIEDFKFLTDLNSYVGQNVDYILGYVISADRQHSELTIECRGTKGLEKGRFVMARNYSIIGKITYIAPEMEKAKVMLITNPDLKTAVRIEGLKQDLKMQGNGDDTTKIGFVSKEETIKTGQKVFAIRQAGFTDSDMFIGTVLKHKTDDKNPLLWDITVQPAWNIEELNEVAVIIKKQQE